MAHVDTEVIDLTESTPHSPVSPEAPVQVRSLRLKKRIHAEATPADNAAVPIIISDGEFDSPPDIASKETRKKRRARKKKKKAATTDGDQVSTNDSHRDGINGNIDVTQRDGNAIFSSSQATPLPESAASVTSACPLFYIDDKPDPGAGDRNAVDGHTKTVTDVKAVSDTLLLPKHVVLDTTRDSGLPVVTEALAALESDTDDFIHYVDAELNVGLSQPQ